MRIAIVGCGPAGLSTALLLHDNQFDVTLFDQFDQPGPVGSGLVLQPTGLAVLETLGLRDRVELLGQRIDSMLGRLAPDGKVVLNVQYNALEKNLYGVAIHRASLFQLLFDAVTKRGIPIKNDRKVTSVSRDENKQLHLNTDTVTIESFDLVVDASGANSSILRSSLPDFKSVDLSFGALWTTVALSGFKENVLEQRYSKASKMIGVLPCGHLPEDDTPLATLFYSIEGKDYQQWKDQGLDAWKKEMKLLWPETSPLIDQIQRADQLTFASYSHHTLKAPFKDGVIFVGDTAHATSPQLGQGANMATLDAVALTIALLQNRGNPAQAGTDYASIRSNHVRMYQSISYLLTPFYQSNSSVLPLLRDTFFEPVTSIGFMNRFITRLGAGMLGNPAAALISNYRQQRITQK